MAGPDQRKYPRIAFRNAVAYRFPEQSVFNGSGGYDLSEGGVRFRSDEFLPVHSQVVVNLQLKSEREATLIGRVAWVQKVPHGENYHIGCEFVQNRENTFSRFVLKNYMDLQKIPLERSR